MAIFVLETDELTSASSSLQSLNSQLSTLINSVGSYETSCEDGFDFASIKERIIKNLEACSIKIKNSASVLDNIVSAHTQLQNGLKFTASSSNQNDTPGSNSVVSNGDKSTGNTRSSNGGGGNSGTVSSGGGGGSASPSYVPVSASTGNTSSGVQKRETSTNTAEEIKPEFNKVGYATFDSQKLSDETKKVAEHEKFKYDDDGYAKLDDKYVITCDSSIGKVGDVLRFTLKDGKTIECVVGLATVGEEYKNSLNFIIDENKAKDFKPKDFSENLLNNIDKVEKVGNCIASTNDPRAGETSSEMVRGAIDWALGVADDDTHGYSQATRFGNPNYDCSSLVISAWDAAGVPVKDAGATYTGDMREAFLSTGQFEWIPGDPDVNTLQPGDVLLSEESHTEMYIGNGQNVGAHSDKDGMDGDSSGAEISVTNYYSHPWDGVLRYIGTK